MNVRPIPPHFVTKVWGSTQLEPWFRNPPEKIGEVWFPAGDLLIKFLFTTEPLSVQVHPGDAFAREHENSRGKTEMWHILRAAPGAQVALGFTTPVEPEELGELCVSGAVMDRLHWHAAHAGDTFFTPAGTVHAIGSGLALCEIQQHSDVTYRMFDYGRPRELHLERALQVAERGGHAGAATATPLGGGGDELVRCAHFATEKRKLSQAEELSGGRFVIVLEGSGTIGDLTFGPGSVFETTFGTVPIAPEAEAVVLLTGTP